MIRNGIYKSSATTLATYVYEQIRDDILNNRYSHGEKLSEMDLSRKFNVSRTPVREALKLLSMDGLVEDVPNRGCFAKGLTSQDINDVYQIRVALEKTLLPWAVERMTAEKLDELAEIFDLMEFYTAKKDYSKLVELGHRFHGLIYESVESPLLGSIMNAYLGLLKESRLESLQKKERLEETLFEHRQILDAFKHRDIEKAVQSSIKHCLNVGEKSINRGTVN